MSGWSNDDVPSQAGRTWAVTSANSGIGLVAIRHRRGAGHPEPVGSTRASRSEEDANRL